MDVVTLALAKKYADTKTSSNNVVTSFWSGTQAEYDLIEIKDPTTLYLIKED